MCYIIIKIQHKILEKYPLRHLAGEGKKETFSNRPEQSVFSNKAFSSQERPFCQTISYWGLSEFNLCKKREIPNSSPLAFDMKERKYPTLALSVLPHGGREILMKLVTL